VGYLRCVDLSEDAGLNPKSEYRNPKQLPLSNFEFRKSSLRMANVMPLDAFRKQSLAAPLSASCEDRAPAFGSHSGAKTVLTLPRSLGWLVSAFHKTETDRDAILRAITVGVSTALSIAWRGRALDLPIARTPIFWDKQPNG
jgi:hypothetical protein